MVEVRCKSCNKLLAKANLMNAAIKCHGCNMVFEYHVFSTLQELSTYDRLQAETTESKGHSPV